MSLFFFFLIIHSDVMFYDLKLDENHYSIGGVKNTDWMCHGQGEVFIF